MILLWLLIVPLVASPLAYVLRKRHFMEAVNLAAFAVLLCLAATLGVRALRSGPVSVWDGFFYADALSALVVLLSAFVALVCSIYAVGYFRHDESNGVFREGEELGGGPAINKLREYYALTPLFVFSMILVALANNLGILWVAIEGTTLASVFLVMFYGRETSLEAAWKYAIIGGVGLSMALFGTILTYYSAHQALGTDTLAGLNWSVLVGNASQFDKPTMRLAFILILLGYGTKAGIAPMHTWKPDAYSEAPIPGAAMLAAGVLNCALYGLVRFYILSAKCLGPGFASHLLILFGLLSMGVAVPFILVQKNFRRMLAYSSIDHSGIMVLALGFGGPLGVLGMLLHMTFHSITKPLLFFCAGNVQQQLKTDLFREAKGGLIHSMPLTGAAFLMVTLAVTGAPPFSLFLSEFTILRAGFSRGYLVLAVLFITFLVAIFSGFLIHIANMVLGPDPGLPPADNCRWKRSSVAGLALVIIVMGFWIPAPLFRLIQGAVGIVTSGR
ncbi:MAG: hydrogenase 4 subunit F [Acidobacteria bacterium]|nr:MAG: hydrogenase 4 subunit F [Acidobacteriota bacterium]PYU70766.1 MAG: hydrogenase 4 subunit F [Acidobacteriota bacterium]